MALVGIDLGTTNSVIAVDGRGEAGRKNDVVSLPSVVAFLPNGTIRVGHVARRRRAIDSVNTIYSSKRIIGRRMDAEVTRNFVTNYPFDIVDSKGFPAFRTRVGDLSPERIAATILEALLQEVGVQPDDAEVVITVPASFGTMQREATQRAADWAGLPRARFVDEPSATALAYVHADHPCKRALVYDLGGGTFDCAVLDCTTETPRVVAHAGDLCLGGDDIDQQIAGWVANYVLEKYRWDLMNHAEVKDRLLAHCESAKQLLSTGEKASVYLSQVDPECPATEDAVTISRDLLDNLCADLVRRTFVTCDGVLRQAGLRPPDVDAVFLAGGTTHLPTIRKGVEAYFGRPGFCELEPTEVVARGARMMAGSVFG